MNNWRYARDIPAGTARGAMTVPRTLALTRTASGLRLLNRPILELHTLRGEHWHWVDETLLPGTNLLANVQGDALEILAEFNVPPTLRQFGFHLRQGARETTTLGYAFQTQHLFLDRTRAGLSTFYEAFARSHWAALPLPDNTLRLHIFVDRTSVEVFAQDGLVNFTDLIFPSAQSLGLELFVEGGVVQVNRLDIFRLQPAEFLF